MNEYEIPGLQDLDQPAILPLDANLPPDTDRRDPAGGRTVSVPADGTAYHFEFTFVPRCFVLDNVSTGTFVLTYGDNTAVTVLAGGLKVMAPPSGIQKVTIQATTSGTGWALLTAWEEPPQYHVFESPGANANAAPIQSDGYVYNGTLFVPAGTMSYIAANPNAPLGQNNAAAVGMFMGDGGGLTAREVWNAPAVDGTSGQNIPSAGMAVQTGTAAFANLRTTVKIINIQALSVTAGTPQLIWTPVLGKKFRVLGWNLSTTVACSILFEDGTGTEKWRSPIEPAGGITSTPGGWGNGYLSTTANQGLYLDVSVTSVLSGEVFGLDE